GMFQVAQARPAADLDRSEDVLLLHDQAEPDGPPAPVKSMGPPSDLAPINGDTPTVPTGKPALPVSKPTPPATGGVPR
ncbi:MAG TPA: rod shape-determining protein MreC, partial [Rhodanobacter sp.]|nr:rod shape-determining protein MreC [Rhodanobacter sp.]